MESFSLWMPFVVFTRRSRTGIVIDRNEVKAWRNGKFCVCVQAGDRIHKRGHLRGIIIDSIEGEAWRGGKF